MGEAIREEIMRRIILACALGSVLGVPAKTFDGTPSPNDPPIGKLVPLDLPFGRPMVCGYAGVCLDLSAQANPSGAAGQGVDPILGTWKMNLEKSTFINSSPPKSLITTWKMEGQNLIATTEGMDAEGHSFKMVVMQIFDGQPQPTTGNPLWDSTSLARVGSITNVVRFKNGKPVAVGYAETVPTKTFTLTQEGLNLNNQLFREVLVFDKQ
jgi:hypothetical protein